jgi:MFS family permease
MLRRVFASTAVSLFGTQISVLVVPLLAIGTLKASTMQVAVLGALEYAPFLMFGLFAGAVMDRRRRRPVMLLADLGRALVLASVPIAWFLNVLSLAQLYVVVLVMGLCTVFFDVAASSFLPDVVDDADLVGANTAFSIAETTAITAGPGAGGVLLGIVSAPAVVIVDVISYLLSALFIGGVSADAEWPAPKVREGSSLRREIREGTLFVRRHCELGPILAIMAVLNFCLFVTHGVLTVHMVRDLQFSSTRIGLLFGLSAAGPIVGVSAAERISRRIGIGTTVWTMTALWCVGITILWSSQRWSVPTVPVLLGLTLANMAVSIVNVLQVSYRSAVTPSYLRGRMNATFRTVLYGVIPLGYLTGGALGTVFDRRTPILIAAIGVALALPFFIASPARRIVGMPSSDPQGLRARLVEPVGEQSGSQVETPAVEVVSGDGGGSRGKGHLGHVYRWNEMKMHVWDLVPRDDQANPLTGEDPLLREADALARHYEMLGHDLGEIDPMFDLGPGHDEGVSGSHRVDREEGDAELVTPDKGSRNLAVDDAGKDGGHGR